MLKHAKLAAGLILRRVMPRQGGTARGESSVDVATMSELLREAEMHHGQYEPTAPKHHWSNWYAPYIVARERGKTPDDAVKDATFHVEGTRVSAEA